MNKILESCKFVNENSKQVKINKDKLAEAEAILDVKLKSASLEIEEIQSLDIVKVAKAKALAYFESLGQPVFVEDVSLEFSGLNGLPGAYIKDFSTALENAVRYVAVAASSASAAIAVFACAESAIPIAISAAPAAAAGE